MNIKSSLLDYSYPSLDPAVFDANLKLHQYQKDFILRLLAKIYDTYNLKQSTQWVTDITIIGSITTSKWITDSDIDVHVLVDINKFIETNMPEASVEEGLKYLDDVRKKFDEAKILLPATLHPCEFYFESIEFNPSNVELVGRYSLLKNEWLKEPIILPADLDYEESKKQVVDEAEALAKELDGSFGKIKRDIQRVQELETIIKAWNKSKQQIFYKKIEKKLNDIEQEIKKNVTIKQDLVDERHAKQDPLSDNEIKFKYLARFGFFTILNNLKNLLKATDGEVTIDELPLIKKIVNSSSIKQAHDVGKKLVVDFDNTIAKENVDKTIGEPMPNVKQSLEKLKELGYEIEIFSVRANDEKGLDAIIEWLNKYNIPFDSIFVGKKPKGLIIDDNAIHFNGDWNSTVQQIQKEAFIYITSTTRYWIDPNGKIYNVNDTHEDWVIDNTKLLQDQYGLWKNHPEELYPEETDNVNAIIPKMLQDGWARVGDLFGHARTSIGQGIEVADLHNIPSSVFNFMSNFSPGKYFMLEDLRKQWVELPLEDLLTDGQQAVNKALQQKRMTHASVKLQTIDPKTFNRTEPYALYIGTGDYGAAGKIDMFNVYGNHPMITKSNAVPTVTLDTLVKNNIPVIGKEPRAGEKQPFQDISSLVKEASTFHKFKPEDKMGEPYAVFLGNQEDPRSPSGFMPLYDIYGDHPRFGSTVTKKTLDELGIPIRQDKRLSNEALLTKQAKVEDIDGIRVYINPNQEELARVAKNFHKEFMHLPYIRALIDNRTGDIYAWDGWFQNHDAMERALGLENAYHWYGDSDEVFHLYALQEDIRRKFTQNKQAQTKKVRQGNYSCIMALVPHELAQEIVAWGVRNIPDDILYIGEDKLGRELESHVTIKYGLLTDDAKSVRRSFNNVKPFKATLGKVRHFQPENLPFDVLTIEVISKDLEKANKMIVDRFDCADDLPANDYKPHVTIAYLKRDTAKDYIGSTEFDGKELTLDKLVFSPAKGNKTYFSIGDDVKSEFISFLNKTAEFLPSFAEHAADNDWQFASGGPDKEIGLDPDPVSDELTWYAPCTEGKPRSPEVWRQFISIFDKPVSKNDTDKVASPPATSDYKKKHIQPLGFSEMMEFRKIAPQDIQDEVDNLIDNNKFNEAWVLMEHYLGHSHKNPHFEKNAETDLKLQEKEKNELGEDDTLLDYSKGFYEPEKHDFPHNTTWYDVEKLPNQHPPYSALPVTLDVVTNPENFGQPGVRRFCGRPDGEYHSNDGEVNDILINLTKDKTEKNSQKQSLIIKQAGEQSASVPDYLINEWRVDQIHDDVDSEPYVNHQERDYPFGMQDAPQSTNDFPWAKDITPYVVRLDILEKPFYRTDPFGIGEYNTVWYESLPASDGIEKGNPD